MTSNQPRRRHALYVVMPALTLTAVSVIGLRAQGQAENPLTAISAKLDQIIALVTPPTVATLSTPAVFVGVGQGVSCYLSNVSTDPIAEIRIRRLNFAAGAELQSATFVNVAPGASVTTALAFDSQSQRCEYSFEGTASMVRAALSVAAGAPTSTIVNVEAR